MECPPQLSLRQYNEGTPEQQAEFCRQLRTALQRWGFVSLVEYGFPPEELEDLFEHSRRFFSLSDEQKLLAPHPPRPNPHRGYSYVGQEFTSTLSRERERAARNGRRLKDLKETFDWGAAHDRLYPNIWPEESMVPGFRSALEKHFARAHDLHMTILRVLAECLDAHSDIFLQAHQRSEGEARLAHYPAVGASSLGHDQGTSRICEHTDSGSVTLLWQDDVGGLEIEDPESHQFIPVRASKPAVLVNLGDAMERWSNGLLPAAYHRVSKPDQSDKPHQAGTVTNGDHVIPARYSIVYFGKPDRGASLAPLERFVTSTRPARYPSVTGAELNQGTLLRTYEDEGVVQDTKDTTGTSDGDHVQILRS